MVQIVCICPALSLIINDSLEKRFVHVPENSYICFQLSKVPQEIFDVIWKSKGFSENSTSFMGGDKALKNL